MMKFLPTVVFAIIVLLVAEGADSIYVNGNIYTVDSGFTVASSIAVQGDRIVFVGDSNEALQNYRTETTTVVDLEGRTVIPGIIESHGHYLNMGTTLERIDLFNQPKAVVLERVKAEAERLEDGVWIVSRGWNNILWNEEFPTKEDLDAVSPKNPVALSRVDGHSTWYNSLAFELNGITKDTVAPDQGGEILKHPDGSLWGILTDTANSLINIPDDSTDQRRLDRFALADQSIISFGITTFVDAGIGYRDLQILEGGYSSGKLKVRAYEMLNEGGFATYVGNGREPVYGNYSGKLSVMSVKLVSDGALGSRSAWLLADYSDRSEHVGNGRWNDDEIKEIVKEVSDKGFQIGTHAIGDAAVRQVIDAYEAVVTDLSERRFRIEHFQIVDADDIPRAIGLGIIPSMQAVHATSDMNMAEDRVGSVRIKSSYAWRTILNNGGIIADGSDAPVELVNPYHGLYAAVTRQARDGTPAGGWYPEQALTREEALRSFTIWGAFASFAENDTGSLEAGKYADFVVLDRDIMTCPASEIKDILPVKTVIGGEVVFEATITNRAEINTVRMAFYLFFIFFLFKTLTF